MSEPIVQATPERVPVLAELLGRAFTDDPMLVWPFGADRTDLVTDFFRAFDERVAALGWLWEVGPGLGVAAWIPPGSGDDMMDVDRAIRPTLASAGARHAEMWEWIASNFPSEPFWYLDHLAVETEHRGSGLGAALIRHGLTFADRDGVPAFLETGRPGNVAYYERRGFRTAAHDDAPGGGPHIWFMRYDPRPSNQGLSDTAIGSRGSAGLIVGTRRRHGQRGDRHEHVVGRLHRGTERHPGAGVGRRRDEAPQLDVRRPDGLRARLR